MRDGSWEETEIGSPQGGVISPLLCNIYLDMFDQKMKALGIRIGAVPKGRPLVSFSSRLGLETGKIRL